jgi:hypothetical protein
MVDLNNHDGYKNDNSENILHMSRIEKQLEKKA